jgi:hypothetical protein
MVGAAPDGARVWIGRPADWYRFAGQLAAILDHALSRKPGSDLYGFLAQPVEDAAAVKDAYAIAIVPGELLSEDAIDEEEREEARVPNPVFVREHEKNLDLDDARALSWLGSELVVSRDALVESIRQVELVVDWLEPQLQIVRWGH